MKESVCSKTLSSLTAMNIWSKFKEAFLTNLVHVIEKQNHFTWSNVEGNSFF